MVTVQYKAVANIKGEPGEKGAQGPAGTFADADARTVPADQPARVRMSGPGTARVAHFDIPRGLPGTGAVPSDEFIGEVLSAPDTKARAGAHLAATELVPARPAFGGSAPVDWSEPWVAMTATQIRQNMAQASGGVPYEPNIIEVPQGTPGRLGRYYMYWSTDHASEANAGIFMAYADSLLGPWTNVMVSGLTIPDWMTGLPGTGSLAEWRSTYHGNNTIYRDFDSTSGFGQTETPWVMPDLTGERRFIMYYQNKNPYSISSEVGQQNTYFAKSDDGITWIPGAKPVAGPLATAVSRRRALEGARFHGLSADGHTGYARFFDIGRYRIAYSLTGGQQWSRQGMWHSTDGMSFTLDRDRYSQHNDIVGRETMKMTGLFRPFQWRGEVWTYGAVQTTGAGGSVPAQSQPVVGRMRSDMRSIMGSLFESPFLPTCTIAGDDGYLYGVRTEGSGNERHIIMRRLRA